MKRERIGSARAATIGALRSSRCAEGPASHFPGSEVGLTTPETITFFVAGLQQFVAPHAGAV